jgi:pectate lyase
MNIKSTLLPILLALTASAFAATPDFAMMGFATTNGGTTGGKGGKVVTPTTLAELKTYAEDKTTPYVIRITKEFNTGVAVKIDGTGAISASGTKTTTYGDIIKLGSNKTLVGIGSNAFFNRIGIIIQTQSNIIIRNIKFSMKDVPIARTDENKIIGWVNGAAKTLSDPDCIGIQADDTATVEANRKSHHIWIDHCEFFNEDPSVMTDVDRYDGLVDGKNNTSYLTISWCYFHDHHKASLMGKGNSDDFDRRVTYSHNYFKNILSRLPLLRFGKAHMLNNYMVTSENGTNARINSDVYIEGNHYEASKKPVFGKISEKGAATFVNNNWVNCDRVPQVILSAGQAAGSDPLSASEEVLAGTFKPSSFYSYKATAVADVPSLVSAYSGVGKISTTEYDVGTTGLSQASHTVAPVAFLREGKLVVNAQPGTAIRVSNLLGAVLYSGTARQAQSQLPVPMEKGLFLVQAGAHSATVAIP